MSSEFAADEQLSPEEATAAAAMDAMLGVEPEEAPVEPQTPPQEEPQAAAPVEEVPQEQAPPQASEDEIRMAKSMGWSEKENWRGPEDKWVNAKEFIDRANPRMILERFNKMERDFETETKRLARAQEETYRRQQEKYQQELRAERDRLTRQYAQAGNFEAVQKVNDNYAELVQQGPQPGAQPTPPETTDWLQKHPQFHTDQQFQHMAYNVMEQLRQSGKPYAEQFAELDSRLSQLFPHYYPAQGRQPSTQPAQQQEMRNAPPANSRDLGGVKVTTRQSGNLAAKLPAEAKRLAQNWVNDGLYKNMEEYAKEYFADE